MSVTRQESGIPSGHCLRDGLKDVVVQTPLSGTIIHTMFPNPRKLHNLLRRISVTDVRKRTGHLLRFDEEMWRRDIVVPALRSVRDLLKGALAVARIRAAIDVCVTDGFVSADWLLAPQKEAESQYEDLGEGEQVHGDDST